MRIDWTKVKAINVNGKSCSQLRVGSKVIWSADTPVPPIEETYYILLEQGGIILTENNEKMEVEH